MDKEREENEFMSWFLKEYGRKPNFLSQDGFDFGTLVGWFSRAKQTITRPVKDATGEH